MSNSLVHRPEGDHNPYDVPLWGRYPLRPTTGESVRVGVQVAGDVGPVTLEVADGSGSSPLALEGDMWWGRIGPFAQDSSYRFVAATGEATDWFPLPIDRWEQDRFVSVDTTPDGVAIATASGRRLTLNAVGTAVDWSFDESVSPSGGGSAASVDGLSVALNDGDAEISVQGRRIVLTGPKWRLTVDDAVRAVGLQWRLVPEESLFGSGERYDSIDQRGSTPDVRVYEQYKGQGSRTYFPTSWIFSNEGYGVSVTNRDRVEFDLGSTSGDVAAAVIPVDKENANGKFYFGDPADLVRAYAVDVGLPTLLPDWAYGPWMSGNEWNSDERVRSEVGRTIDEGIPASVIVIEAWSDETTFYLFNDSAYDPVEGSAGVPYSGMRHGGKWPDPRQLVEWLHERGVRVLLWQIPILKEVDGHPQHDADVAYASAEGLAVAAGESAYRNRGWWFPGGQVIDFTNPEARQWWFAKRAWLLDDLGIDGFKTDGGEHLWGDDVVTHAGEHGDIAANRYPVHYLKSYHDFLSAAGHERPLLFSRAGFTGAQAFPAHWAGDEDSTWEAYRSSLTAGLTAGLSGIGYWSWDIGGFSGPIPTSELYQRATAMGAFSPIMQYHSEHNDHQVPNVDRTPWNIADRTDDAASLETYRWYSRVRMNLVPYLTKVGAETSDTGMPMMRALVLHYPDDPEAVAIDDEYLLGPDLLVAPVLTPGASERRVYLPDGRWWSLWDGDEYDAGWHDVETAINEIPVFVRGGAAVPLWIGDDGLLGSPVDLPGEGSGALVHMVFPGNGTGHTTHPVTGETYRLTVGEQEGVTKISGEAGSGLDLWIRGLSPDDLRRRTVGTFEERL